MRKRFGLSLVFLLMGSGVRGQSAEARPPAPAPDRAADTASAPASPPGPQLGQRNPRYKVGRGDVVDISFPRVPEFNQVVTIQPDGYITLRGAGDLYVAGQTVPELMQSVKTGYSKILHEPLITIDLKDFEKPYFTAFGLVEKPGKYDLRGEVTMTQALAIAGGFRQGAKQSEVLLFRRLSSQWTEVKKIDLGRMLRAGGDLREDPEILPGDILFVPKSLFGKIERYIPTANVGTMLKPY